MDSEILTLQVDINDDPMNQKVDAIEERLSTLQKDAKQVAKDVTPSTESLPGYNDAFIRKLADWEKSLTDIGRTRSSMEHAMSSYEQKDLSTSYKRKVEIANRSIKDLANSQTLVSELLNSFGPGMSQVFSKGLEGIVSQLSTGIKTTAMSISSEVSRKLTDDEIVDRYMRSGEYGRIVQKLNKTHPNASKVYTPQNMRQYLMANVPMSVPQYMREAITGGSQVPILKQPESYREMLPKSFQKIEPHAERGQIRQLGQISHANETLSTDEISALGRIVRNNRYAADAAVKAGIISKSGQKIYFNHAANHDMMDAMAGFIMDDMTRAAQGERKYGIDNVENPNFWKNISNKRGSNKVFDGTLAAAYAMHDAFGSWLNPGRFGTGFMPFSAASGNAEYLGRINHSPRKTSRAFAEYTLDMMQNGAQISGMHPIVQDKNGRWTELSRINGPVSAKNSPTGKSITPDDFHTISMNDSLLYKMVMSSPNAKRVGQNGFSDNMFYLKFSDELGDPGLTKERRAELQQQYADLFRNGYKVNGEDYIRTRISKTHAEFMKAAIVDDIGRKALGMEYARPGDQPLDEATAAKVRKAGLDALSNGGYSNGHSGHFDTFKPFAKTMYNQNNMATEGESLATWLGTTFGFRGNDTTAKMIRQGMGENERQRIMEDFGTPNMKVVVGSFGKADMDGSNWISDRISSKGFQGRTFNGKATYVPINMMDMRARNFQQIEMTEEAQRRVAEINAQAQKDIEEANRTLSGKKLAKRLNSIESHRAKNEAYAVAQLGGDWIIPGAGINGNDLRVSKDTDVIEDVNNIKNFKTHLQDDVKSGKITQEQMNEMRSRDYSRDEIFAKTTYDDANTSSRWLSKQVINSSMNAGFRDPRVQQYFNKVFFDELARMDDDQYVRDLLFKGDQSVDLQSEKAQKTISDHIAGMWAQYNEGDRLLPTGAFKFAMAAPNPQSVINNRLKAAGIALTPEQNALELGNNQVISMESLNKQLGIIRFPATKTGNVTVNNVSAEQLIKNGGATKSQIERLAKSSGIVDTKGLYFAPDSPILKLLQGEDFDGDLNGYFGLSDNMNPKEAKEFSEAMRIIGNASDKEVEQIWGAKPGTPEFEAAWKKQEARKEAQTRQSVAKVGGYDLSNPDDAAAYLVNVPREHAMMGAAERSADMAALYYAGLNDPKIRGNLAQAIKDYESQYDVVSTNMKTDESWKRTNEQAYAADRGLSFSRMFKYANDAIQTTGENDESVRIWNGKSQEYLRDKNVDQLGLPSLFQGSIMGTLMGRMKSRQQGIDPEGGIYNWDQVLDAVKLPEGVSADSEQGKFVQMMRGVRKGFLESKYLVASNQTVDALQAQYEKAVGEIESSIDPTSPEGRALKKERLKAIGAQAFDNFKQYGATERNLANATWAQASLDDFAKQNGVSVDQLVGNASFVAGVQAAVQASEPEKTFQRPEAVKNATVTTSKTLPEEARAPFEQKTAQEMLAQETPQQQAKRLLKEAGVRNRDTILDANQRDALVSAIANNDLAALIELNGVGKKNAPKIMAALQGSSLLGLKTTSPEEMQKAVATATAPSVAPKAQPEPELVCGVCGTTYPASMGHCPNEANHPNKKKQTKGEKQQTPTQPTTPPPTTPSPTTPAQPQAQSPSPYGGTTPSWGGNNPPPGGPPNNPPSGGPLSPSSGGNSWDAQAAQAYYGQLMGRAQEFSGKLFGEILNYEQQNKGEFDSIIKANRNDAIAARYEQQIRDFQASADYQYLTDDQKRNMDNLISPRNGLVAKAGRDFSEMSMFSTSQLLENIGNAEQKASGTYDAQVEALNKWDEKIKEVEADQKRLLEMSSDPKYSKDLQDQFKKSADKIGEDLTSINRSRQNIEISMQDQNQKTFDKQIENLENKRHPGNKYEQQSRQYQQQISDIRDNLTSKHNAGLISDDAFNKDMGRLKDLEKQTSVSALSMQDAFKSIGTSLTKSLTNLASRFGRQLFQKALTEAKKFVQEFDKTMTSIQMITLKSDEQMSTLGDSLIAKAKELKISVAEITQSAETLYRQGLSDEEVDERLDVISKFSKVSGTKVDAATKLITVAMNTGLVTDPRIAADVVTALGDNAATNASEIEKGIEKAGAAAAADGTTFAQLASMLTAITSTTQIGGNVAGRTLNTIFGRMNKIGTNELIYDENGNAISGSDVSKLLAAQGIRTYDEKGNKRSSYDVLYDLSQVWDSLEDATQQQLASQIAGTRQYSNFAAIMQGMSEGKVSEYMSLSENAEGITDQKYEIYTKSLQASLTDLKNTFDALVEDLVDKGYVQDFISGITTMINGVDNLVNALGGLQMALPLVMTLVGALNGLKFGGVGALVGAAIGLGSYAGLTALGQGDNNVDFEQIAIDGHKKQTETARSNLEKAQNMYESYKNGRLSEEEVSTFDKLLSDIDVSISGAFSEAERAALGLSGTFENVSDKLDAYAAAIEAKAKKETEQEFRKYTSVDLSDLIASRYENGDGRTYTEDEKAFYDYITEHYADDGTIGWGHNGVEDYVRDIVSRGLSSDGSVSPGYFLDVYRDRINEWVKQGKFIQAYKKEGDEYTPIPYTDIQDLYRDLATYDFVDENGVETQAGSNVKKLFELIMTSGGDAGFNENMESQEAFARDIVSTTYGERLKTSLSKLGYVDDNLASLVTDAYIDSVMQGVRGQIIESNAIGREPDIPGAIADESKRIFGNMYDFLQADNPLNAFQNYVIESKKQDTEFLEEHAEELKGLNDEGMSAAIRGILFPTVPALKEEEVQEIAQDVLHAGAATGYSTWSTDKSNAYGLAADAMLRNFESAGVSDAVSLRAYLQTTDGRDWKYLTQNNGELAQLVNSIQYDEDGNIINPDVYNQIIDTLYANSKARGARFVPEQEKAEKAQSMLTSIAEGEVGYLSWDDALAAAEAEEQANRDTYEASIQEALTRTREKYKETQSPEELEKGMARYEELYRENNPYTGQTAEQIAAGYRIYTADEQKYLKETVGEELYDRLTGKNGQTASIEEQAYAQTLVNNKRYGISGLTSRQQLEGMHDVQRIISEGSLANYSEPVANAYMAQFAGWGEYSSLIKRQQAGEILSPEEQKQLETLQQNFDNIVQSAQIKVDIEGVQQLESAGKVAEGTAAKLEKLQKDGHIAIEVETSLKTEAFDQAQQNAKLVNGTQTERDEVAMALLGMSREQYYANRNDNYQLALNTQSARNTLNGNTWAELYNADGLTDEQRAAIDAAARAAGYRAIESDVYYDDTGRHSTRGYEYANEGSVEHVGRYVGTERTRTESELTAARLRIVNGTLTAESDNELYNAAVGGLGTYGQKVLWARENGTYNELDEETKRLARQEAEQAAKDAREAEMLERARLSSQTAGGAFAYQQVQYEQNNKAALAAEAIFGSLTPNKVKNWDDLMNSVNGSQASNWKELINSSADLSKKLSDMGVTVDDAGQLDFSEVEASGYELADVLNILRQAASDASDSLNGFKEVLSTGESAARAQAYFNGEFDAENKNREAFASYIDNQQIADIVQNNELAYRAQQEEYDEYMSLSARDRITWRENHGYRPTKPNEYDPFAGLEGENLLYAQSLYANAAYGNPALSEVERINGFNMLFGSARNGTIGELRNADRVGYYQDYVGAVSGGDEYLRMIEQIQEYESSSGVKVNLNDYDQLSKAFGGSRDEASRFLQVQKDVRAELAGASARATKKAGEYTDAYADSLSRLNKGGVTARKEMARLTDEMKDYQDGITAAQQSKGKTGKQIVKDKTAVKMFNQYLGFDEDDIRTWGKDEAARMSDLLNDTVQEQFSEENFRSMLQGAFDDISASVGGDPIEIDKIIDLIVNPQTGNIDYSAFVALLQSIDSDYAAIAEEYSGHLLDWFITISKIMNGDSASVSVDRSVGKLKSGSGKSPYNKRSSGGGGGGKSKTDAIIEGQSHYIKRREHDVTMAQERETRYEKVNNYQGYLNALNDEIAAQERLKSQYSANITALTEQLSTLKEGTEEWYKCQEAIDSAEESMAKIDNEIDSINSKKINITETKQANQDKPISHASTMLQLKAENYLEQGQFEKYEAVTRAQIANYANDISVNNQQIAEWEELLATYEEGSSDWITVRDKIWEIKEQNAELENDMLKETHALEQAKISQIATDLQNALAPLEHEQNMLDTWGNIYQNDRQYGAYRGALSAQSELNRGRAEFYQSSINELQAQMKTLEEGSQAWLDARSAIYEYQEALAQVTASIQENDTAIEESYVSELTNRYEDASRTAEHELKMVQTMAARYKEEGDYTNYEHMLEAQRDLMGNQLAVQRNSLAEMEALFNSGKLREGSEQWRVLREQIMSLRETVLATENDYASLVREVRLTKFENTVEQFNTKDNEVQHELRMIQYDETRYQNAGELTNYGKALEWDNAAQQRRADLIQEQIDLLKEQRDAARDDPQLYNKIDAEIMKMEEQLASTNNTIEKNNKLIEKNQDAIRKLQQNIENTLDKEIKARKKFERDMLAGTIATQSSMLEVIKKRYTDEFNLVKKDIENKKKALNQEKSLINERLNARKRAIDAEDKYETLAEYQKQLAIISADPTRSKDAKELRRKIADLQKEISWSIITEDQAKAETEAIDDQIKALDDEVQVRTEDLNEMLEDSRNFADELNKIMGGSYEDYVSWMKENSESYKNATDETRKQMELGWHDTWLKMKGETETYWEEVAAFMQNKDDFLNFMKQSQEYINASDVGKISLERQWSEMYDDYQASLVDNAEFYDNHEVLEKMSEMKDWTYKVEPIVDPTYNYGQYSTGLEYLWYRDKDNTAGVAQAAIDQAYDQYSSIVGSEASLYESQRKKEEESSVPQITINVSGGSSSGGTTTTTTPTTTDTDKYFEVYDERGIRTNYVINAKDKSAAKTKLKSTLGDKYYSVSGSGMDTKPTWATKVYKHGGLIDFTGPAWVDGTKLEPEGILSAYDTKAIQALTDVLDRVYVAPGYAPSSEYFTRGNTNIGDINVTINQAELKDDADFNDVARRVGKVITKQLNKEGFNLGRYAF